MITTDQMTERLKSAFFNATIRVDTDGYYYTVEIVSDAFLNVRTVKRHQLVYAVFNDLIASGELHALTIKAYTTIEWETMRG